MGNENESPVLATRVLTYLKRFNGNGLKPTEAETNAAATALQLLSVTNPDFSGDPESMFEKLKQIARKSADGSVKPVPKMSEADIFKYQQSLAKLNRMYEMYSKIMANSHEMKKSLIANFPR